MFFSDAQNPKKTYFFFIIIFFCYIGFNCPFGNLNYLLNIYNVIYIGVGIEHIGNG